MDTKAGTTAGKVRRLGPRIPLTAFDAIVRQLLRRGVPADEARKIALAQAGIADRPGKLVEVNNARTSRMVIRFG